MVEILGQYVFHFNKNCRKVFPTRKLGSTITSCKTKGKTSTRRIIECVLLLPEPSLLVRVRVCTFVWVTSPFPSKVVPVLLHTKNDLVSDTPTRESPVTTIEPKPSPRSPTRNPNLLVTQSRLNRRQIHWDRFNRLERIGVKIILLLLLQRWSLPTTLLLYLIYIHFVSLITHCVRFDIIK